MKSILEHRFARVVAVVAHPDDESLFCGGTLRRLVEENRCQVAVVCATDVAYVNAPRSPNYGLFAERARQNRRLVAFGQACGAIGVDRVVMLDLPNSRDEAGANEVEERLVDVLAPVLIDLAPACVLTHNSMGDYGHEQHKAVCRATRRAWSGDLWHFSDFSREAVEVDRDFKTRLLDFYRRGTTQDPYWSPRADPRHLGPWLGAIEHFTPGADPR